MRKIRAAFFALVIFSSQSLSASIELPAIIGSNMVLQRNSEVAIWGWAEPGEKIVLDCSWVDERFSVDANEKGKWLLRIPTTGSKEAQTISVKCKGSEKILENILFGEVWYCSGQSNMEQPVKGFMGQPTFGSREAILNGSNPHIRLFTVKRGTSLEPLSRLKTKSSWQVADPESVSEFSAVAYFFGHILNQVLDVPVGLIHSSWGGSSIEAWMDGASLSKIQEFELSETDIDDRPNVTPTLLYNAMAHPLIPYTLKGMIWYQGETNRAKPEQYKKLQPAMVRHYRECFLSGEFPFYFVQIAPFHYWEAKDAYSDTWNSAYMREAQLECVEVIPNSGLAITMDVGEEYYIHPPKKYPVAQRLADLALHRDYGITALDPYSPVYDSHEVMDSSIILYFKYAEMGIYAKGELSGFEVAGSDRIFYPADAHIVDRTKVEVTCEKVPDPVAARYCWTNYAEGTLFGTNLLPVSSFRTDNWDNAKRLKE